MKKRELKKFFKDNDVSKSRTIDFDYEYNGKYIKLLNTNPNTQLTINSPTVFEMVNGKVDGIRFIRKSSVLTRFNKNQQVILVLLGKPFKILKYINENEVVDISNEKTAHSIQIVQSYDDLKSILT